jgi:hypothetical protein
MSFADSAALFLLRIGIMGEDGTLSVASKSSVKSLERFDGDKAVASMMAVLFGVDLNNPEDNEASMPKAVPFVADLLLFEDNEAVASVMASC